AGTSLWPARAARTVRTAHTWSRAVAGYRSRVSEALGDPQGWFGFRRSRVVILAMPLVFSSLRLVQSEHGPSQGRRQGTPPGPVLRLQPSGYLEPDSRLHTLAPLRSCAAREYQASRGKIAIHGAFDASGCGTWLALHPAHEGGPPVPRRLAAAGRMRAAAPHRRCQRHDSGGRGGRTELPSERERRALLRHLPGANRRGAAPGKDRGPRRRPRAAGRPPP